MVMPSETDTEQPSLSEQGSTVATVLTVVVPFLMTRENATVGDIPGVIVDNIQWYVAGLAAAVLFFPFSSIWTAPIMHLVAPYVLVAAYLPLDLALPTFGASVSIFSGVLFAIVCVALFGLTNYFRELSTPEEQRQEMLLEMASEGFVLPTDARGVPPELVDEIGEVDEVTPGVVLDDNLPIAVIGETGGGKSNTIKTLAAQFDPVAPTVVFDYKSDYVDFYIDEGERIPVADGGSRSPGDVSFVDSLAHQGSGQNQAADATLGGSSTAAPSATKAGPVPEDVAILSDRGSTVSWNIFAEAERESDLDELARLVAGTMDSQEDYFAQAAQQVLAGVLKLIARESSSLPNNLAVKRFFEDPIGDMDNVNSAREAVYLRLSQHTDLKPAARQLDPDSDKRAESVWATLQAQVSTIFRDDLAGTGDFSVREFMAGETKETTLIFNYPTARAETIGPIFRVLLDRAIQIALDTPRQRQYFVLDEFAAIDPLDNLERLVNAGRAEGAISIFGLQSTEQVEETYREGSSIVAGFPQIICHQPANDGGETAKFLQQAIGKERQIVESVSVQEDELDDQVSRTYSERDRYQITSAELNQLGTGEGYVVAKEWWSWVDVAEATPALLSEMQAVSETLREWERRQMRSG